MDGNGVVMLSGAAFPPVLNMNTRLPWGAIWFFFFSAITFSKDTDVNSDTSLEPIKYFVSVPPASVDGAVDTDGSADGLYDTDGTKEGDAESTASTVDTDGSAGGLYDTDGAK
jgi:hypothetical protein